MAVTYTWSDWYPIFDVKIKRIITNYSIRISIYILPINIIKGDIYFPLGETRSLIVVSNWVSKQFTCIQEISMIRGLLMVPIPIGTIRFKAQDNADYHSWDNMFDTKYLNYNKLPLIFCKKSFRTGTSMGLLQCCFFVRIMFWWHLSMLPICCLSHVTIISMSVFLIDYEIDI